MPDVELPELGESVTEVVILSWLVEVGDEVTEDQPLAEISTDKVDTEIPSPSAGVVRELRAEVDETVQPGQVIAVIGEPGEEPGPGDEEEARAAEVAEEEPEPEAEEPTDEAPREPVTTARQTGTRPSGDGQAEGGTALTSPLVRRMLRRAGLSPREVEATGEGGRITRADAERAIAAGAREPEEREPAATGAPPAPQPAPPEQARASGPAGPAPEATSGRAAAPERPPASPLQVDFEGQRELTEDLSRTRRLIAEAMHTSLQTTAQLTAAVEADVSGIMNLRNAHKEAFRQTHGISLSPLPFMARAACMTIPRHPAVNGSIDLEEGTATFHRYINLGVAVDTERGLLVPNIKDAQDLTVPALARQINDLARRTRDKQIRPDDIQGATFTITNTGSRGTLLDTPILNPPEVAILATCAIEKRAVVVSDQHGDSIAIRWMTYLCLTYDHRMLDGADAARFLQDLKWVLENHDFSAELGR